MIEPLNFPRFLLIAVALAVAFSGCGSSENQTPVVDSTSPAATTEQTPVSGPVPDPVEAVSRERALRAMRCQIVLSQSIGVAMANADTGLPSDLASRLKVSVAARWEKFVEAHAQAAGVQDSDRAAIVVQLNPLSPTDEDRQKTIDTVRDCLDNEP